VSDTPGFDLRPSTFDLRASVFGLRSSPAALQECVRQLFASHPEWESLPHVDAFTEASSALLRRVLTSGAVARANALDLRAADACVTWAFEAAADDPAGIAGRAELVTLRIAAIAAEFSNA
jgi:hypothetical protein